MAQRWHWLRLRATCHQTEDADRVRQALATCAAMSGEDLAAATEETRMEAHHGGDVILFDVTMTRARDVRAALGAVWTPEHAATLREELEPRVDDHGVFHFRVSKQAAFGGEVALTRGDDAIQYRLKPEVHPASREASVEAVAAALQE